MADNRIAYGLAKKYGIDTRGMSPKEVWEALKGKGITQANAQEKYSAQSEKREKAEKIYNSDGIGGEHIPTPAEKKRLEELGISGKKKARKQLAPPVIDTSNMKFENSFQEVMYRSKQRKKLNALQTMEDIGVSEDKAYAINKNIAIFTGSGFRNIRDLSNKEFDEARNLINEYIEKSPTYEGDIYRGVAFNDGGKFANLLKNGNIIDMKGISSWSDSPEIADKFANKFDKATYGVILTCKNKSGVGIQHLSILPEEKEVLHGSKSRFKIKDVTVGKNSRGLKIYKVNCEEI